VAVADPPGRAWGIGWAVVALAPVPPGRKIVGVVSAGKPPSSPSLAGVLLAACCVANGGACSALLRRSNLRFPVGGLALDRA
jgi:hypothetical protein